MKLFQLNATCNWGSTGKIAEGIGIQAQKRGWESYIAYGRYHNPSNSNIIKVGRDLDVYTHYARSKFLNQEGLGSRKSTHKLISTLKEIKPDIIHLHNIHDHWLNYPILFEYFKTIETQIVWTFHDFWAFTGGCQIIENDDCTEWQRGCKIGCLKDKLIKQSHKNLFMKSSLLKGLRGRLQVVSVSNWIDEKVRNSVINDLSHCVIHNGVDINLFKERHKSELDTKYNLRNKFVILGVCSVWAPHKGLTDFFKLRQKLNEDHTIILIGLSKKQIRQLPPGIIGIERTSNLEALTEFYSRADVLMSFSLIETFGMTLIEGQACGTPSIAYNNSAMKEVVAINKTGFCISPGDIDSAVNYIKMISEGKIFSSNEIRNYVIQNFNAEKQFNKYIDLYEELLSKK